MSEEFVVEDTLEPVIEEAVAQTDSPVKSAKETQSTEEVSADADKPVEQKVITGHKKEKSDKVSNVHTKEDGAIGSHAADRALNKKVDTTSKKDKKEESDKVAIWSEKNMRWSDVGALVKGYNIVTKEAADKWLSKKGIRKATPEEVATYYGK